MQGPERVSSPHATARRQWLRQASALGLLAWAGPAAHSAAAGSLGTQPLSFPQDHGSHPQNRIEWWYLTGYLREAGNMREAGNTPDSTLPSFGFQVTFFRSRVEEAQSLQSAFAARQLLLAHAALTDVAAGRLLHDQRIARSGFGIAQASESDTAVRLRDWTLARAPSGVYTTQILAPEFALALQCRTTQPLLLQGQQGLSRKGPQAQQASRYYSQPQLAVSGTVRLKGQVRPVQGRAWLDHEWSDELLHPQAVGWDWIGMNLDDGAALTAFRLRTAAGQASATGSETAQALWAGGSWRSARGELTVFNELQVRFEPLRWWTSPATQTRYPVAWRVHTPAGTFDVQALADAQELDSRATTGAVYWEGISRLNDSQGRRVGLGYLEMTGYTSPLKL